MDISEFINKHALPEAYKQVAIQWFFPVFEKIFSSSNKYNRPHIIGINGSQGSGKSTLGDLFRYVAEHYYNRDVLCLSLDDFYLTRNEREILASNVHPLLITRGVPGTHDIDLAMDVISSLKDFSTPVSIPRFDKAVDDRTEDDQWDLVSKQPDIIVLEGWCLGADAQAKDELLIPLNNLETAEDPQAIWRRYVNQQLKRNYQPLFSQVDIWLMLKAPSFECVFDWRLEQEDKLACTVAKNEKNASAVMNREEVSHFIQHYQRITENTLSTLPQKVHYLFELNNQREVINLSHPLSADNLT